MACTPRNSVFVPDTSDSCVDVDVKSPFSYFKRYITDEVIDNVVEKTNICELQKANPFRVTCAEEIKTFSGLLIAMGHLKYPRMRMYWEEAYRINLFY